MADQQTERYPTEVIMLLRMGLEPEAFFDAVWDYCDGEGLCDGPGGAEYQRIRAAWFTGDNNPWQLYGFIKREANRPARPQ